MDLSNKIINKLISLSFLDKENKEIYVFGLFVFLNHLIIVISSLWLNYLYGLELELIAFTLFIIILRSNTGGFHFKKYNKCILISLLELVVVGYILKKNQIFSNFFIIIFIISLILVLLSPVDTKNRRLNNKIKRKIKYKVIILLLLGISLTTIFYRLTLEKYIFSYIVALIHCVVLILFGIIDNKIRE